jgi:hypothetical protein
MNNIKNEDKVFVMTKIEHLKYKKKALIKCLHKKQQRNQFLKISVPESIRFFIILSAMSILLPLCSVFIVVLFTGEIQLESFLYVMFVFFICTLPFSAGLLILSLLTDKKNKKINSLIEKLKRDSLINNENVEYYYEKMKYMSKEELDRVGNPIVEKILRLKKEKNRSDNNYLELQKLVAFENINNEGVLINE